jgi:GNAT superfamily N-acetyltransferase
LSHLEQPGAQQRVYQGLLVLAKEPELWQLLLTGEGTTLSDMLVKLYTLPPLVPVLARQRQGGIDIRRALAAEKHIVVNWVAQSFFPEWVDECDVAFSQLPATCFIAVEHDQLLGFACHDATYRNFFGPTGVNPEQRGRGIGQALLLACLHAMAARGYAYAIIGGVGPVDFYAKTVGATVIEGSEPGVYRGMLKNED